MSSESKAPGFEPNFKHSYEIVIPYPLVDVFSVIGTAKGHERVCHLSSLCTNVELLQSDTVSIPESASLSDIHVRTLPSAGDSETPRRILPRQFFKLTESVPILFLTTHDVHLSGTLTWDENAKTALYESISDSGIRVWKLRVFEEVGENSTRVSERIEGSCPKWLRWIVQKQTAKAHSAHLESYSSLFS